MDEQTIFNNALEKCSPEERAAYLDVVCDRDADLRRRVESLLAAHDEADDFLDRPAFEVETQIASCSADDNRPAVPATIGPYEILDLIGQGAMGLVFKARDAKLNRTVAVKVLADGLARDPAAHVRFLREAQSAAAVVHPNVITIHAVCDDTNSPYLVMEYLEGASLADRIRERGTLAIPEILRIGAQIADGLAAAHHQGLIHRDIKPANILLEDRNGRVKITDFGLARAIDDLSITRTGEVIGTPTFMAPEQAEGKRIDHRSDLFSLGSVLYTMATGQSPFRADSAIATLRMICDKPPRPIRELNPEVPEPLAEIIARLMEKDPDDRIPSAWEVAGLLRWLLADPQQPGPRSETNPEPRRPRGRASRRNWLSPVVGLLVLATGLGTTEATGVTHLTATVLRLVTGEGTLVVEVDDPNVRVMIDGEDLIIKGAGIQEIRLRSGQHTFQAMKDGKVLKHELITVTSRGRRVVRVSHEVEPLVADEAWKRSVAAMSADEQIAAVRERLKSLNPSFDGQLKGTIHLGILERLSVHGMGLRDLSPLTVFENLSWLEFADKNPVRDLTPIASLDLPSLSLGSPLLTDLSPLKNCKGLTYLDLTNCRRLSDLRPLAGIALTQLHLSGAAVYDLSPLKGMKLEVLNCEICERLTDITPLAGMPMRKLYLRGTGVTDLSPLRGMPLKTFDYVSTHVTDITPLKDLPLEGVHCDFEPGRDAAILRSIRTLRTINGQPASEFWKAVDNTVRGSDAAR